MGERRRAAHRAPARGTCVSGPRDLLALESYAPGLDAQAFAAASASGGRRSRRDSLSAPVDVPRQVCGSDFVTVLSSCASRERIHSHFQNIAQVLRDEPDGLPPSSTCADADRGRPAGQVRAWLATRLNHVADNLYVRTLLGRAASDLPFGAVEPLTSARRSRCCRLSTEMVLPLAERRPRARRRARLAQLRARARTSRHSQGAAARFAPFDADEAEWLAEINRHDYALDDQARALHALDVEALRSACHGTRPSARRGARAHDGRSAESVPAGVRHGR